MTVPAARRDPRLRRYPLRRLRLPMAGGTLSIVVPATAAWLHDGGWAAAAARGQEPPYWADVWPASVAIARWLARQPGLGGRRVLDLGCGLGVPGTAAARGGAEVTFADLHHDALAFAAFNAAAQGAPRERVRCVQHDWHGPTLPGQFDLVCLADVSYRPVHHAALLRHLREGLAADGLVVHADPFRRESDGFVAQLAREFAVHQDTCDTHFAEHRLPVRIALVARSVAALQAWRQVGEPRGADRKPGGAATEAQ